MLFLRFNLPPPNEHVDHIRYLVFGSGEYEEETTQYYIELNKWWREDKAGPKPRHWRQRVRDPWAGINIWCDPESEPTLETGYQRTQLYDPVLLQDMLLDSPRIIRSVHATIEDEGSTTAMRRVQRDLLSFFRNEFKTELDSTSTGNSVGWSRVFKFLEASVDSIANCLLLNYELYPLEWSTRVMQHGEPSARWLEHVACVNQSSVDGSAAVKPARKVERIMSSISSGNFELEPEPIKGITYDDEQ